MDPKTAFLFPGQGAQKMGMGKELYESYPPTKEIFSLADRISHFDLTSIILKGPQETLNQTIYSQPAILTVSYAALKALQEKTNLSAIFTAGLSLGEYTSLIYAQSLDFETALKLVLNRAKFMQEACDAIPGTMVSLLNIGREKVDEIVAEISKEGVLAVANHNSPTQIVISGEKKTVEKAAEACKKEGARAFPLQVAGAYHSPLMKPAQEKLAPFIETTEFSSPQIMIISNALARPVKSPSEIKKALIDQVTHPVEWVRSMEYLLAQGMEKGFEIGPGTVLKGLMRQIQKKVEVHPIAALEDLRPWQKGEQP